MPLLSDTPRCVKCGEPLRLSRLRVDSVSCVCWADNHIRPFPALLEPEAKVADEIVGPNGQVSTCFAHPDRAASSVCSVCGRFACSLCSVVDSGRSLCLDCFAATQEKGNTRRRIVRWDSIAISLAVLPLLMWPLTCLTAPAAIFVALTHWKPQHYGFQTRSLIKLIAALLVASAQIAFWIAVLANMDPK